MPDFCGVDSRPVRRQAREYSMEQQFARAERPERHIIATAKNDVALLCSAKTFGVVQDYVLQMYTKSSISGAFSSLHACVPTETLRTP
jgi:hypothetical protein